MTIQPIKIGIIDDHDLFRDAIARPLKEDKRFNIVIEARNGADALRESILKLPDILLVDINMPLLGGLPLLEKLKQNNLQPKIIIVTGAINVDNFISACQSGASGYLLKDNISTERLAIYILAVMHGATVIDPMIMEQLLPIINEQHARALINHTDQLSASNKILLRYMALGYETAKIAELLGMSAKTIANRKSQILKIIQARNNVQATHYALQTGLIKLSDLTTLS